MQRVAFEVELVMIEDRHLALRVYVYIYIFILLYICIKENESSKCMYAHNFLSPEPNWIYFLYVCYRQGLHRRIYGGEKFAVLVSNITNNKCSNVII